MRCLIVLNLMEIFQIGMLGGLDVCMQCFGILNLKVISQNGLINQIIKNKRPGLISGFLFSPQDLIYEHLIILL